MPSRVVVGYWSTRALVQPIRVMLAHMAIPFEDCRYQVGDAPKFDKSAWAEAIPVLEASGMHFPNLPYLIDLDGTQLTQTHTIMRYLAASRPEHGLMGQDLKQTTQADMLSEVVHDIMGPFCRMTYSSWALDFKQKGGHFLNAQLPPLLTRLESSMNACGGTWCTGTTLTYADFLVHEALYQISKFSTEALSNFQGLKAFMANFEALPNVAKYVGAAEYLHTPFHNRYSNFAVWKDGEPLLDEPTGPMSFVQRVYWPPLSEEEAAATKSLDALLAQ